MINQEDSIRQLTETVNALTLALAKTEKRYQSIEKVFRWIGIAFLSGVLIFFYGASELISKAQATSEQPEVLMKLKQAVAQLFESPKGVEQTLSDISSLVKNMNTLVQTMNNGNAALGKVLEPLNLEVMKQLSDKNNCKKPDAKGCNPMEVIVNSIAAVPILMNRIKQDSDFLRKGDKTYDALGNIRQELHLLNTALRSVPDMVIEMHEMNRRMGLMARDMDSTLGTAGRMMPWW